MNTWQHTKVDISQAVVMLCFWAFSQTLTNAAVAVESEPSQQIRSDTRRFCTAILGMGGNGDKPGGRPGSSRDDWPGPGAFVGSSVLMR